MAGRGRPPGRATVLTTAQIKQVLCTARSRARHADRAFTALTLTLGLGLTAAELAGLRCGDVFDNNGAVRPSMRIRERTGSRSRMMLISSGPVRQALEIYGERRLPWRVTTPDASLFTSQKRSVLTPASMARFLTALYREAGVYRATSRSGRGTAIARLAESGVDAATIADFVGQSSGRIAVQIEANPSRLRRGLRSLLP